MQLFLGEYCSSLNSKDLYDDDLVLTSYRSHGGTMVLWKKELDPHIKVHKVTSSSFLPIIFDPPNLQSMWQSIFQPVEKNLNF